MHYIHLRAKTRALTASVLSALVVIPAVSVAAVNINSQPEIIAESPATTRHLLLAGAEADLSENDEVVVAADHEWDVAGADVAVTKDAPRRVAARKGVTKVSWKAEVKAGATPADTAYNFIGAPYRAGYNGRRLDCSGLVASVYALHGISMPGSSGSYAGSSLVREISKDELRPGDIIHTPGHVGIWLGSNSQIDTASGRGTKVVPIWQYDTNKKITYYRSVSVG